jgi:hypothetical protein
MQQQEQAYNYLYEQERMNNQQWEILSVNPEI